MTDRPNIPWQEWLWVAVASLLLMGFVSAPYLIGAAHSSPEMVFSGHLFNLTDIYSYIAKMREGAVGGWTYTLAYTYEPHHPAFVYPFYLGLGKLAAWVSGQGAHVSGETLAVAYHIARVVCGLILLTVIYRFVAAFLAEAPKRRMAWALAALASGLGWLPTVLHLLGAMPVTPRLPVSYYIPEAFTILLLYGFPHLALVRALVELAHRLKMDVLVAGVDDEASAARLETLGCDLMQGAFVGRPLETAEFIKAFRAD